MLKYRLGEKLTNVHQIFRSRAKHTKKQTKTSSLLIQAYEKTEGKNIKWEKTDFSKIKSAIRRNVEIPTPEGVTCKKFWNNIRKSSRSLRRVDLNYLIVHKKLPLAAFLSKIKVTNDDSCRLCLLEPETQEHLFYQCTKIKELKKILNEDLRKSTGIENLLSYDLLVTHLPVQSSHLNEILSIYKQSIWQTRAALHTATNLDVEREIK